MTTRTDLDRVVADWLAGTAGEGTPEYLEETLDFASSVRQRRWWSSPERWLPMIVSARTESWAPSPRILRVLVVAAVVLAVVGAAILVAGSRQRRLPPPFGPANNGMLTFSTSGNIYALDSIDATPRLLIPGTLGFGPGFSRDGTQLSFMRGSCDTGSGAALMVANVDGSNVRQLVDLSECPSGFDVSPDGSLLAFAGSYGGTDGIYLLKTDGSDRPHHLDLGPNHVGWPTWRPPDGHELLYFEWDAVNLRLDTIRPDGSAGHVVKDLGPIDNSTLGQLDPSLSADGRFLVYAAFDGIRFRNHLVDLATGQDLRLSLGPAGGHELHGQLSPDGTKLLFHDADASASEIQEMLAPIDGSSTAIPIGPPYPVVNGSANLAQAFSPDGRTILISQGTQVRIIDAATGGPGRSAGWQTGDLPGWQRTAR